jgi:DNA repair exonuclease SbcCD ATPase subunit
MNLDRVAYTNVGIFTDRVELPLADQGLVLVRGDNHLSQSADDNGSGKSLLFSGLSVGLYGVALPGPDGKMLRGEDVACRFTKGPALVELFGSDGDRIVRGARPSGVFLQLDGKAWTTAGWAGQWPKETEVVDEREINEKIVQAVGFGAVTFRNAVVFGQGVAERLATADQSQYLKMLDEIQGVDFREARKRAEAWRDEWRGTLGDLVNEAATLSNQRQLSEFQVRDLEAALAQFSHGKRERLALAEQVVKAAGEDVAAAEKALEAVRAKGKQAAALRTKWNRVVELNTKFVELGATYHEHVRTFDRSREEVERVIADTEALIHKARCPTCRREIAGKAEVARIKKLFAPDLQQARERLEQADAKVKESDRAVKEATTILERHLKALPGVDERVVAQAEAEGGERALLQAGGAVEAAQIREQAAKDALKAERSRTWEGQAALDAARKQSEEAVAGLTENAKQQERAQRTIAAADYWTEAFGDRGLRSLLFESVADYLNDRLAHHLEALTAGEADVTVSALTALKKGSVKEKMSVNAAWAWGAGSYGGGSAGQSGRVNIALLAAHQDLAEHRSAKPFPWRIWDEPECHIDARGKEILAEWIQREAARRSTTFLVTHDALLAELVQPDHVWTVVLDRGGARVEIA